MPCRGIPAYATVPAPDPADNPDCFAFLADGLWSCNHSLAVGSPKLFTFLSEPYKQYLPHLMNVILRHILSQPLTD